MTTLYILCGLPFSGKTLLSKKIAEITSIERVSFDDEWDKLKVADPQITYEQGLNKIENILREKLKEGFSVVYDSVNLSKKHRDKLEELAKEIDAEAKIVYLQTSVEEIYKRREQSLLDNSHHFLEKDFIDESNGRLEAPNNCILISNEKEKDDFLESLT